METFRFDAIRGSDTAAMLRLVGEVTELAPDKNARRTHVLKRLLSLIGGRSAVIVEIAKPEEGPFARPGTIININYSCEAEARYSEMYLIHNTPADPALPAFLAARRQTLTMSREIQDREFKRSQHYDIVRRPWDIDHSLYCRLPL